MTSFDHFAQPHTTLVGNWIVQQTKEREFSLIHQFLRDTQSVILEIGAGKGQLAECFLRAGYKNYMAVEPHDGMRQLLKSKGIITRDYWVPPLPEADNYCGAIISSNVFEHLNNTQEAIAFILEAQRVLRPSGILCIAAPDYLHWKQDFFNADFSHSYITSIRRIMQLFYDHGFRTIKHTYLSAFFVGFPATVISHCVRYALSFPKGNQIDSKLYKLKLTFLRRFLILGMKDTDAP